MASASAIPLGAHPLQLPNSKSEDKRFKGAQGAVKCLVQRSNLLGNPFPAITIGRRARHSSSRSKRAAAGHKINKYKVSAAAGVPEPSAELEGAESDHELEGKSMNLLHRREMFLAATGTFSYLSSVGLGAQAAPVPPPDMDVDHCIPVGIANQRKESCCLPNGKNLLPIEFQFEDLPMRTRRPAHLAFASNEYMAKLNEAYRKMRNLPDSDPRSFKNQWHIHCAFCEGAYLEPGNNSGKPFALQYHGSWSFLPWHRMYLYFHERILGELVGDPTLTLPFWNWDNQRPEGGNQMPRLYTDETDKLGRSLPNLELRKGLRDSTHLPGKLPQTYVDLADIQSEKLSEIFRSNLSIIHRAVISTTCAELFMGGSYRANQSEESNCPGAAETDGHNAVHRWTGTRNTGLYPDEEDMGTFIYAGRDPIFYSHHSNVDRLWTVWKSLNTDEATRSHRRRREESKESDFLDTKFAFYDHKKRLVHIKVSDTLDTEKLGYKYEQLPSDRDWIDFKTVPSGAPKPSGSAIAGFGQTPKILSKVEPRSFLLQRRACTESEIREHEDEQLESDDLEEALLIKGVNIPDTNSMTFRVFLNLPSANEKTPLDIHEFVGVITHIAHHGEDGYDFSGGHHHSPDGVNFRVSIGASLKSLNIQPGESVSVTFVPSRSQQVDVRFVGLESEWR